jgi:hypothetical protein
MLVTEEMLPTTDLVRFLPPNGRAMKIAPSPQCPESDSWPSKRRPSRWATKRHSTPSVVRDYRVFLESRPAGEEGLMSIDNSC